MAARTALILLVAALAAAQDGPVPVAFVVPEAVADRVRGTSWHSGALPPVPVPVPSGGAVVREGRPGEEGFFQVDLDDGRYLLDGPFVWPRLPGTRAVPLDPRRTVSGAWPPAVASATGLPAWYDVDGQPAWAWPRCSGGPRGWICTGVPATGAGVMVAPLDRGGLVAAAIREDGASATFAGAWGALVRVEPEAAVPPHLSVRVPLEAVPARGGRLDVAPARGCRLVPLTPVATLLVCETADPVELWVSRAGFAGERHAIEVPPVGLSVVRVILAPERRLDGRVEFADGSPAAGAQVSVSRLVERQARGRRERVRLDAGETVADEQGRFALGGLDPADPVEALAAHPSGGRARRTVAANHSGEVRLRLAAGAVVEGRVVARGAPVAGALVEADVPTGVHLTLADATDAVGLPVRTGSDGRFRLALPPVGSSGLRIQVDGRTTRVPLPTPPPALTVLGDVELAPGVVLHVELAGGGQCAVTAIGPMHASGVTVIRGTGDGAAWRLPLPEPGVWMLRALCAGQEVPVEPALVEIPAGAERWRTLAVPASRSR